MAKHLPTAWHRPFLAETGLSHLMDEFIGDFTDVGFGILPSLGWTDVFEKDGSVIYEMKLPGVAKDDVEIKVDQGRLVVSGEVRRNEEVKQKNSFRIGRRHGQLPQCLRFPPDIKNERAIGATLWYGILRVTVPLSKSIQEKSKPIGVKVETHEPQRPQDNAGWILEAVPASGEPLLRAT